MTQRIPIFTWSTNINEQTLGSLGITAVDSAGLARPTVGEWAGSAARFLSRRCAAGMWISPRPAGVVSEKLNEAADSTIKPLCWVTTDETALGWVEVINQN